MKLILTFILICACLVSCYSQQKKASSKKSVDSATINKVRRETPVPIQVNWVELRDTTVNGIQLQFVSLTKEKYDSLSAFIIRTKIPLQAADHLVRKAGSCQVIKLKSDEIDSLCGKNQPNGYFEKFEIKGLWREKDVLLVGYQNWEDANDFFLNLSTVYHYALNPEYKLSPSKSLMISYTNIIKFPIYSGGLMLSDMSHDPIRRLLYLELGSLTVTQADWLTNEICLVTAGVAESMKLKSSLYYLLTLKKAK